jgi:hypothetical protein
MDGSGLKPANQICGWSAGWLRLGGGRSQFPFDRPPLRSEGRSDATAFSNANNAGPIENAKAMPSRARRPAIRAFDVAKLRQKQRTRKPPIDARLDGEEEAE